MDKISLHSITFHEDNDVGTSNGDFIQSRTDAVGLKTPKTNGVINGNVNGQVAPIKNSIVFDVNSHPLSRLEETIHSKQHSNSAVKYAVQQNGKYDAENGARPVTQEWNGSQNLAEKEPIIEPVRYIETDDGEISLDHIHCHRKHTKQTNELNLDDSESDDSSYYDSCTLNCALDQPEDYYNDHFTAELKSPQIQDIIDETCAEITEGSNPGNRNRPITYNDPDVESEFNGLGVISKLTQQRQYNDGSYSEPIEGRINGFIAFHDVGVKSELKELNVDLISRSTARKDFNQDDLNVDQDDLNQSENSDDRVYESFEFKDDVDFSVRHGIENDDYPEQLSELDSLHAVSSPMVNFETEKLEKEYSLPLHQTKQKFPNQDLPDFSQLDLNQNFVTFEEHEYHESLPVTLLEDSVIKINRNNADNRKTSIDTTSASVCEEKKNLPSVVLLKQNEDTKQTRDIKQTNDTKQTKNTVSVSLEYQSEIVAKNIDHSGVENEESESRLSTPRANGKSRGDAKERLRQKLNPRCNVLASQGDTGLGGQFESQNIELIHKVSSKASNCTESVSLDDVSNSTLLTTNTHTEQNKRFAEESLFTKSNNAESIETNGQTTSPKSRLLKSLGSEKKDVETGCEIYDRPKDYNAPVNYSKDQYLLNGKSSIEKICKSTKEGSSIRLLDEKLINRKYSTLREDHKLLEYTIPFTGMPEENSAFNKQNESYRGVINPDSYCDYDSRSHADFVLDTISKSDQRSYKKNKEVLYSSFAMPTFSSSLSDLEYLGLKDSHEIQYDYNPCNISDVSSLDDEGLISSDDDDVNFQRFYYQSFSRNAAPKSQGLNHFSGHQSGFYKETVERNSNGLKKTPVNKSNDEYLLSSDDDDDLLQSYKPQNTEKRSIYKNVELQSISSFNSYNNSVDLSSDEMEEEIGSQNYDNKMKKTTEISKQEKFSFHRSYYNMKVAEILANVTLESKLKQLREKQESILRDQKRKRETRHRDTTFKIQQRLIQLSQQC